MHKHSGQMKNGTVYDDIERAMVDSDSKYKIITGDFNEKIGELKQKKTPKACKHLE